MSTGFAWHELFNFHDTGTSAGLVSAGLNVQPLAHVESAESKSRFAVLVAATGVGDRLERIAVVPVTDDDLLRVHTAAHVDRIRRDSGGLGGDCGDGASPFGPGSFEIAKLSAGGLLGCVRAVMVGEVENAYALSRPPGHHAVRDFGMGFCIFANIPVAVEAVRAERGPMRVAVVDYDVHHGNGTQSIYYDDPQTLTISLHQEGLFPLKSGGVDERGTGAGEGYAINVPLPAGSGNGAYLTAFERVVAPAVRRFAPDLIVVASGFDSCSNDPLGRMMVTADGYRQLTAIVMSLADELCGGRLVFAHEGGYSPTYVPYCGIAVVQELARLEDRVADPFEAVFGVIPGQGLRPWQSDAIDAAARSAGLVT
jgi:acetoin utilization deacetylase AcuC-like enzyme